MGDLKRHKNDFLTLYHEMGPDIAVGEPEFLGGDERHDDSPRRIPETVGLDHDDEWNDPPVPSGVEVDTELVRHQIVSNSSARVPYLATKAASAAI